MPENTEKELIAIVSRLFDEGRIQHFLGYQKGTVKFKTTPLIARNREDLRGLWVDDFFAANLALYLKEIKGKVGLLVKGCDSRSLVSLIKEGQVKREDLYVVGIPCPGQIDPGKVAEAVACESEELEEITRRGSEVAVRVNGQEKMLPKVQALLDKCLDCQYPKPLIFDSPAPRGIRSASTRDSSERKTNSAKNPYRRNGPSGPTSLSAASAVMPVGMFARPASAPAASWKKTCPSGFLPSQRWGIILSST